jgi:hypothetical protein
VVFDDERLWIPRSLRLKRPLHQTTPRWSTPRSVLSAPSVGSDARGHPPSRP